MTSNYDWLPDRHLGAAASLAHADKLISQVGDLLFAYQVESEEVIGLREESNGQVNRLTVESLLPIPRQMPLLVADALVALRGVLEHTLFSEVEYLDGPLPEKWARLIEMPARTTYDSFADWKKKRDRQGPPSLSTNSVLMARIESLQPFHRRRSPADHPLARLVSYTNHAKHRTPAVAAVMLPVVYREDELPSSFADLDKRPAEPLRLGEVVFESPVGEVVPLALWPTIGLNRPGTDEWPILMHELRDIFAWVREQALPRLVTGGDPPADVLPAWYEISVGHADERRAISEGCHTTAFERQEHRLQSALAREQLVEMLGLAPGAPASEQIRRWAEQLTDKLAIEQVDRFTVFAGPPSMVAEMRARAVLDDMAGEVRAFVDGGAVNGG